MISKKLNNNRDEAVEAKIKKVAIAKLQDNPDGFFIQNGNVPLRTIDKDLAIKTIKGMPFDNAIMHFRMATVGKKNVENVHGWEQAGFQFLHNGIVSDYSPKRTAGYNFNTTETNPGLNWEHTDSYMLFQDLLKKIAEYGNSDKKIIKAIKYTINNLEFWGRAVLIDKAQDKAFIFGDWHTYIIDKSYLLFSSTDINVGQDYVVKSHGVSFEYSTKPLLESEFDGVAIIKHFNQPNFHWKFRTELEDNTLDERKYVYEDDDTPKTTYHSGGYYGQKEDEERWAQEDAELEAKYSGNPLLDKDEQEAELVDIMTNIPEYGGMNPFDMNVYTDETGTHDECNICCENDVCWIYNSPQYKDYIEECRKDANQQELDFLNGIKKEKETSEVLVEV